MNENNCLYIDALNSGISGDMFLASLLDLSSNPETILNSLRLLPEFLSGISKLALDLGKVDRFGLKVNQLQIDIKEKKHHRTITVLQESLTNFLAEMSLSQSARDYARNVLNSLVQAEAKVHGKDVEDIHLHELSSVDTLIDIAGVTIALDEMKIFENNSPVYCSLVPLGGGTVTTAHGVLSVPAPATSKIIEGSPLIFKGGPVPSELVTPTGASLLINLSPKPLDYFPEMKIKKIGYGCGQKKFPDFSNILRLIYGDLNDNPYISQEFFYLRKYVEKVTEIETDVDDISGEVIGNFIKRMEKEEILDIQVISSLTKKNRPGQVIKILCNPHLTFNIMEMVFEELGTLGVRFHTIERACVERKMEMKTIEINGVSYQLRYKLSFIETSAGKKIINMKPEFEDLREISEKSRIPVNKLLLIINRQLNDNDN